MENNSDRIKKTVARNKQNLGMIAPEIGKLPPQAVDLEQAVLGAMMLDKNAINDTIDILTPNSF